MSLPFKITLLLSAIVVLFISVHSTFLYLQIDQSFRQQAEAHMLLCTTLLQHRIDNLQQNLRTEMRQLSGSLFMENEATLANMMTDPPQFNTEVLHFAETLRRRTTLQFLTVIASDGTVLSSSEHPADFGKPDPFPGFPQDEPAYVDEGGATRLEMQERSEFGGRILMLRGGYLLQSELEHLNFPGLRIRIHSKNGATPLPAPTVDEFSRTLALKDYRNTPLLLITVSFSTAELMAQRRTVISNSIALIVLSLLASLVLGHLLSRWISRPLAQLTDAALLMSVGQLDVRVPRDAGGEVGELVTAFNRMAEQLEEKQQLLARTERIAAWQEIARHLAHEIKNPLTPIRTSITNLRLALEKAPEKFPEIFLESSESVLEEVEKLRRLADEFSRFARLPAPELRTASLNDLIQRCLVLYRDQPDVRIEFQPGEIPDFPIDAGQITEVLHNLVRNALDAVTSGGVIRIATSVDQTRSRREIVLKVEDTGKGMSEEIRRQVFAPYFTTKEKGTGLGLAIVQRIITEHRGRITVDSSLGQGTQFEIRFEI